MTPATLTVWVDVKGPEEIVIPAIFISMAHFVNKNVMKGVIIVLKGYVIGMMDSVYVDVKTNYLGTCVIRLDILK